MRRRPPAATEVAEGVRRWCAIQGKCLPGALAQESAARAARAGTQDEPAMLERLRQAEELVVAARPEGGEPLQAALAARFAARRALAEASLTATAAELARGQERFKRVALELTELPREVGVFFDLRGNELLRYSGSLDELAYPRGDPSRGRDPGEQWAGAVHLHNHVPRLSPFGPSAEDLLAACRLRCTSYRVVSKWRDSWWLHVLRAPHGWPAVAVAMADEHAALLLEELQRQGRRRRRGDDPAAVALEHVAGQFGLEYRRERLSP